MGVFVLEFFRFDLLCCFFCLLFVFVLNIGIIGGVIDFGLEFGFVKVLLDFLVRNFGIIFGFWLLLELIVWELIVWELIVWEGLNRCLLILYDVCDVVGF